MKPIHLLLEPYGYCPLRCIGCAHGRREYRYSRKQLDPDSLERILNRIAGQTRIGTINLCHLGEPLLHPKLPDLVRIAKQFSRRVLISTSGNFIGCDLEELVDSRPDVLIVSMSGYTQPIYGATHRGGSVENVKEFIGELARLNARNVSIVFHRYKHNLHEEAPLRRFVRSRGMKFVPAWGEHFHLEALVHGQDNPYCIVPIKELLELAATRRDFECCLQKRGLLIDAQGGLRACAFSTSLDLVGNIFKEPLDTLMERKVQHPLCETCYRTGAYKISGIQDTVMNRAAARRLKAPLATKIKWRIEELRKRLWVWIEM